MKNIVTFTQPLRQFLSSSFYWVCCRRKLRQDTLSVSVYIPMASSNICFSCVIMSHKSKGFSAENPSPFIVSTWVWEAIFLELLLLFAVWSPDYHCLSPAHRTHRIQLLFNCRLKALSGGHFLILLAKELGIKRIAPCSSQQFSIALTSPFFTPLSATRFYQRAPVAAFGDSRCWKIHPEGQSFLLVFVSFSGW